MACRAWSARAGPRRRAAPPTSRSAARRGARRSRPSASSRSSRARSSRPLPGRLHCDSSAVGLPITAEVGASPCVGSPCVAVGHVGLVVLRLERLGQRRVDGADLLDLRGDERLVDLRRLLRIGDARLDRLLLLSLELGARARGPAAASCASSALITASLGGAATVGVWRRRLATSASSSAASCGSTFATSAIASSSNCASIWCGVLRCERQLLLGLLGLLLDQRGNARILAGQRQLLLLEASAGPRARWRPPCLLRSPRGRSRRSLRVSPLVVAGAAGGLGGADPTRRRQ